MTCPQCPQGSFGPGLYFSLFFRVMIFHVGIYLASKSVLIYDSLRSDTKEIELKFDEKEYSNQDEITFNESYKQNIKANYHLASQIQTVFEEIVQVCDGELGSVCIISKTCNNELRKFFLQCGLQAGFRKIEFIDVYTACYLYAIIQSTYIPKNDDIIWVVSCDKCIVWQHTNNKAEYMCSFKGVFKEKEVFASFLDDTKIELRPNVILFIDKRDKSYINILSTKYHCLIHQHLSGQEIINESIYDLVIRDGCLLYARIMANDLSLVGYYVEKVLQRDFLLKYETADTTGNENIVKFPQKQRLNALIIKVENSPNKLTIANQIPFSNCQSTDFINEINDLKQMHCEIRLPKTMDSRELALIYTIDTNGVYDVRLELFVPNLFHNADEFINAFYSNTVLAAEHLKFINLAPSFKYSEEFVFKTSSNDSRINAFGIDWGSTRCCAAVNRKHGIETVALDNMGERLLPSYVSYDEKTVKCGQVVVQRLRYHDNASVFYTKQIIGTTLGNVTLDKSWTFGIAEMENKVKIQVMGHNGQTEKYPEEIAAALLKHIKKEIQQFQGKILNDAVITYPAAFNEAQKHAVFDAAIMAEWKTVRLLPEPVAAAFAYFVDRPIPNNSTLLLFDLGGGTMDICIFKVQNNEITFIRRSGDPNLGGRDFDNLLVDYFDEKLKAKYGIHVTGNKRFKIMLKCQEIKENLSKSVFDQLNVDDFHADKEGSLTISQKEFEKLSAGLLIRIRLNIETTLKNAGFSAKEMDKVLYVGGGCRMPMIKNLLQDIFPQSEHCCQENPDEVVAIGAAYYAHYSLKEGLSPNTPKHFHFPKTELSNDDTFCAIGIDLGTTRCCAAVNRNNGILTVPLDSKGGRLLPSYVSFDEENEKCGSVVVNRIINHAPSTVFDFKRILGRTLGTVRLDKNWTFQIAGINNKAKIQAQSYNGKLIKHPEEIAADTLKYIKQKAEEFQGKKLHDVVITVPIAFNERQIRGIQAACLLAEFQAITILPEPVAVAFTYLIDQPIEEDTTLLIFDLGGGTLDVCVFIFRDKKLKIVSKGGNSNLGGRNFDNLLYEYFETKLFDMFNISIGNKKHKLMLECQKIKECLSWNEETILHVDDFEVSIDEFLKITREEFEAMAVELVFEIGEIVRHVLHAVFYEPEKIDKVLYAGGGCRMPMIKNLLQDIFPQSQQCCESRPDEVVAVGAAHYAYNVKNDMDICETPNHLIQQNHDGENSYQYSYDPNINKLKCSLM